jgi:hypothetical protein
VRKYVSSPTTSKKLYLVRIGIYKVVYKAKNKRIRARRRIIRVLLGIAFLQVHSCTVRVIGRSQADNRYPIAHNGLNICLQDVK